MAEDKILESLVLELRRGTLVLSVLSQVATPQYGYSLVQRLEDKGLKIDANSLYPLLRRLEKQGLVESEWDTTEAKPRKYYKRTAYGDTIYTQLKALWEEMNQTMQALFNEL